MLKLRKALSIKNFCSQREGGLPSPKNFRTREFFKCGRPHFLVQISRIFEIYGVPARTRRVEPVLTRGEGSKFLVILCGRL